MATDLTEQTASTVMTKDSYAPSWLPVDGPPWRLVNTRDGSFLKGPDKKSLTFATDAAALTYATRHKVLLAGGLDKTGSPR